MVLKELILTISTLEGCGSFVFTESAGQSGRMD